MHVLVLWGGFLGAWLLFAGPIYQAALELGEEGLDRDELRTAAAGRTPTPPVSPWWWLIPPVGYILTKRRAKQERREVFALLTPQTQAGYIALSNKATGWVFVASGAALLATTETWNLVEHYDWASWVFWVLTAVMLLLSAVNTSVRLRQSRSAQNS